MKRPRVLLVDDMPEVIQYCVGLLAAEYEVVGTASNGAAAISAVAATRPEVIVLDISMPGLSGIEVARRLRGDGCQAVIVFLSSDDELSNVAMAMGGSAFVSKVLAESNLSKAIGEALAGRRYVALSQDGSRTEQRQSPLPRS